MARLIKNYMKAKKPMWRCGDDKICLTLRNYKCADLLCGCESKVTTFSVRWRFDTMSANKLLDVFVKWAVNSAQIKEQFWDVTAEELKAILVEEWWIESIEGDEEFKEQIIDQILAF